MSPYVMLDAMEHRLHGSMKNLRINCVPQGGGAPSFPFNVAGRWEPAMSERDLLEVEPTHAPHVHPPLQGVAVAGLWRPTGALSSDHITSTPMSTPMMPPPAALPNR